MRAWWTTRSRARIWDAAAPVTAARPSEPTAAPAPPEPAAAPEPVEAALIPEPPAAVVPPAPRPVVAPAEPPVAVAPPAPAPPPESAPAPAPQEASTHAPLFDPRPDDFAPREANAVAEPHAVPSPLEVTIAESAYYDRTSLAGVDPEPAPAPTPAPVPAAAPAAPTPNGPGLDSQGEFLRLLEVVTSMCDHVIEYIEADRAERRQMMEMLTQLGRVITEGSAAAVAAFTALSTANTNAAVHANPALPIEPAAAATLLPTPMAAPEPVAAALPRERVIGGSMPAGPEPHLDLVACRVESRRPRVRDAGVGQDPHPVEVRGKFGDRWVDGFEICEVMSTPSGPRYKLRRQRDGVVLPELFDATNIRHVATAEELAAEAADEANSAATPDEPQTSRERSMGSHPSGTNGDSAPVNGSGYWSRS